MTFHESILVFFRIDWTTQIKKSIAKQFIFKDSALFLSIDTIDDDLLFNGIPPPGHVPRLSQINLLTLLSLWLELFPQEQPEEDDQNKVGVQRDTPLHIAYN